MTHRGCHRRPSDILQAAESLNMGPDRDCSLCTRLADYRKHNRDREPSWFNAPVPDFHPKSDCTSVRLLIVGLAPGLRGANRTGRPFTGDAAGKLLYPTLIKFGFAIDNSSTELHDGLSLVGCQITNAVRCVPPQNRPTASEVNMCRQFLSAAINSLDKLSGILALGTIAHLSVLTALGYKRSNYPFSHGKIYDFSSGPFLANSYHCSRYNVNTGRLTSAMFEEVFSVLRKRLNLPA